MLCLSGATRSAARKRLGLPTDGERLFVPLLDGWRLLQTTSVYGPAGTSTLAGNKAHKTVSVGRIMLLGKSELVRRVLADKRITIYEGGRQDIATGQIDRRVQLDGERGELTPLISQRITARGAEPFSGAD